MGNKHLASPNFVYNLIRSQFYKLLFIQRMHKLKNEQLEERTILFEHDMIEFTKNMETE